MLITSSKLSEIKIWKSSYTILCGLLEKIKNDILLKLNFLFTLLPVNYTVKYKLPVTVWIQHNVLNTVSRWINSAKRREIQYENITIEKLIPHWTNTVVSNYVNSNHVPSFSCHDVWNVRQTTSGVYAISVTTSTYHICSRRWSRL